MVEYSREITILVGIVLIFGLGISGYAVINEEDFTYRLFVELRDWLKIETEVNKGKGK